MALIYSSHCFTCFSLPVRQRLVTSGYLVLNVRGVTHVYTGPGLNFFHKPHCHEPQFLYFPIRPSNAHSHVCNSVPTTSSDSPLTPRVMNKTSCQVCASAKKLSHKTTSSKTSHDTTDLSKKPDISTLVLPLF